MVRPYAVESGWLTTKGVAMINGDFGFVISDKSVRSEYTGCSINELRTGPELLLELIDLVGVVESCSVSPRRHVLIYINPGYDEALQKALVKGVMVQSFQGLDAPAIMLNLIGTELLRLEEYKDELKGFWSMSSAKNHAFDYRFCGDFVKARIAGLTRCLSPMHCSIGDVLVGTLDDLAIV